MKKNPYEKTMKAVREWLNQWERDNGITLSTLHRAKTAFSLRPQTIRAIGLALKKPMTEVDALVESMYDERK